MSIVPRPLPGEATRVRSGSPPTLDSDLLYSVMATRVLQVASWAVRGLAAMGRHLSSAEVEAETGRWRVEVGGLRVEDERVQELLFRMTGMDFDRIFASRTEPLVPPQYRLLTEAQLKKAHADAVSKAKELLAMPPVMAERKEGGREIEENERLSGYLEHRMVFTDISEHRENRSRRVVVRGCDGTLREASHDEHHRMCEVYFPVLGRRMWLPAMLEGDSLTSALQRDQHADLLDLACAQCEPDSKDFLRVHYAVYEDIESRRLYECLRSTRHFGGLVWYLLGHEREEGLLRDMLSRQLLADAEALAQLYLLCHTHSSLAKEAAGLEGVELVEAYCRHYGLSELLTGKDQEEGTVTADHSH